jgi:hypothetical protein
MQRLAVIAALAGVALWLWAAPAVARAPGAQSDGTLSADRKHDHKHKHKDGGSEMDEEREEELHW